MNALETELQAAVLAATMEIPAFAALAASMPPPTEAEQQRSKAHMEAALCRGEWEPHLTALRENGSRFALMGIALHDWYGLLAPYRRTLLPYLVEHHGQDPGLLCDTFLALTEYVDRSMLAIGSGYLVEREELARTSQERAEGLSRERDLFQVIFRTAPNPRRLYRLGEGGALTLVDDNRAMTTLLGEAPLRLEDSDLQAQVRGVLEHETVSFGFLVEDHLNVTRAFDAVAHRLSEGYVTLDLAEATTRRDLGNELVTKAELLRRSNEELEQFAYIASHDLQEPLRMVASYTELLAKRYEGKLDEKADQYIHYAVDGAKRMKTLINDLLSYSRVGTRTVAFERTDLNELLETVLTNLSVTIRERQAEIVRPPLPEVMVDATQMSMVLQNLIANAIKFSKEKPHVTVNVEQRAGDFLFSVHDQGIGIEPGQEDRIFKMFQRLHGRGSFPGNGVGLALVKRIIERHGGEVWYASAPGEGTTFSFTLPHRPASAAARGST